MSTTTWESCYPPEFVKWAKETVAEVELCKQEGRTPSIDPVWIEMAEDAMSLTDFEVADPCPNYDIKTSPMIVFQSFQIHRNFGLHPRDFTSFSVYGHIKLTTDYDKDYFLFEREISDPIAVRFNNDGNNNTTFTFPKSHLRDYHWLPKFFWLEVYLVDKNRTVTLVNEEFLLDFRHRVHYDTTQMIIYDAGRYGTFTVNYTIYRLAALGCLSFDIFEPKNRFSKHGTDVSVSGTITATERGQTLSYNKSQEFKHAILSTNHINSLPAIAISVYSHLKVKVDLVVDGQHILCDDSSLEFKPCCTRVPLRVEFVQGKWCISITLCWMDAFAKLPNDDFVGEMISYDRYLESYLTSEREHNALTQSMRDSPLRFARYLGEVFSVSIFRFLHPRNLPFFIHGTIELNGHLIFEKNKYNMEAINQHQPLSLLNPNCCYEGLEKGFRMNFDLMDDNFSELCKGCVDWDLGLTYRLHDRRMCSVVIGDLGLAYVHYAIFDNAIQAHLNVRFLSVLRSSFKVYGKIYARYGNYRYSTHYERKYFRIMLFKKQKADSLNIICDGEIDHDIPLSKDVIAVPCGDDDASLILELELHVVGGGKSRGRKSDCTIKGELIFNPRKSDMVCSKKIEGKNPVEVEVKWS